MAEMILPGVYIEVRPEGLIVPGRVTVGNIGIVGTASKGAIGKPTILGSYAEARERFGLYDPWNNGTGKLTLVRALEQVYNNGATTVIAVRVADETKAKASIYMLKSASDTDAVKLSAKSAGTWGDGLSINVFEANEDAFVTGEPVDIAAAMTLKRKPVVPNARNQIVIKGRPRKLVYTGSAASGEVKIDPETGGLTFPSGEEPQTGDAVEASYLVKSKKADKKTDNALRVTLRFGRAEETYTAVDVKDLVHDINARSAWVTTLLVPEADPKAGELPKKSAKKDDFALFLGGDDGADGANYSEGLEKLLDQDVQIIVAAGQDDSFGDELDAHCQSASTDTIKRDRIAVVGSSASADTSDSTDPVTSHTLASDRLIFVAPGIKVLDNAVTPPVDVALPGAYAAAAVAGLLAGLEPHFSPTNKTLRVGGLAKRYSDAELTQLVKSRVLALENRKGFRIVKGVTTSTNTAWTQITTRRIVDFAKYGVRSAANSYIGLLNNDRVRGALRATINSFLAEMVADEKLVSYDLSVTATRDQERQGIVQVTMTLRPTFSIDYIKVTMFLE
ncbi:MAG: phage tail sheath subtilisin-like domain-containing protein [Phormidesmis sp. CAN_BIN44]|nr:phage tail sheath subtilisin-like domain-containing protein [Phormidesmis sp. CAN_BIN44]